MKRTPFPGRPACGRRTRADGVRVRQRPAAPPATRPRPGARTGRRRGSERRGRRRHHRRLGRLHRERHLGEIYAAALNTKGIKATTKLRIGAREAYMAGMKDGSINLVPEYTGTLLQYLNPSATATKPDEVYTALQADGGQDHADTQGAGQVGGGGQGLGDRSPRTPRPSTTSSHRRPRPVAKDMILGGPSEWKTRPTGVPGLEQGLRTSRSRSSRSPTPAAR